MRCFRVAIRSGWCPDSSVRKVFFGSDLESRLLWSTALAVYVDLQLGKEIVESRSRPRAVDLGAGVGLTCLVLMRTGVSEVEELGVEAAGTWECEWIQAHLSPAVLDFTPEH